jgi:hypothetical protein
VTFSFGPVTWARSRSIVWKRSTASSRSGFGRGVAVTVGVRVTVAVTVTVGVRVAVGVGVPVGEGVVRGVGVLAAGGGVGSPAAAALDDQAGDGWLAPLGWREVGERRVGLAAGQQHDRTDEHREPHASILGTNGSAMPSGKR